MRRVGLLLTGLMLFCLGIVLSLLATTASEAAFAPPGADARHAEGGIMGPLAEDGNYYFLTPADDPQETNKRPVNASLMTMLVLVMTSSFGALTLWLLATNSRKRGAIRSCRGAAGGRTWLVGTHDGLSFLGVFLR